MCQSFFFCDCVGGGYGGTSNSDVRVCRVQKKKKKNKRNREK